MKHSKHPCDPSTTFRPSPKSKHTFQQRRNTPTSLPTFHLPCLYIKKGRKSKNIPTHHHQNQTKLQKLISLLSLSYS